MAEAVQEKSRGLKFAEQQLLRHGWEHGKGLGRAGNGISEAIKVKVKCDKGGVGHKEGEQFTFHWWDHVFNKASSSLQVESDHNGIKLKKTAEEEEEDGMISNKKPRKATLAKAKLYGCFVKSATLLSGQEQPEPTSSNSDDSSGSDEDEEQTLDLSSTTKLSDRDLIKACGGRTAHKGARHGLKMSAKLARLEQQEAEFMAKYGKKSQPASSSPALVAPTPPTSQPERQETAEDGCRKKEKKKKKKKEKKKETSRESFDEQEMENPETDVKPKKKKKKNKDAEEREAEIICVESDEEDLSEKRKRRNAVGQYGGEMTRSPAAESSEETHELHSASKAKKKKRKKSSSEPGEGEGSNEGESRTAPEEAQVSTEEKKKKRKKCKKDKPLMDDQADEQVLPPKRKKKKSKD
ncbi:G patch domain-containing protein 4 [Odontesthes bonariensis]|uniref:G patch domain-containing protein 4 n=1 Tax=Odontesthes bonariensis TaxID=219752 RepID=UPI003F58F263